MQRTPAPLRLKRHEDRRLRAGHPWVFSNEVDMDATPLSGFTPGGVCVIEDSRGEALGTGYANPHSLICARLISRDPGRLLDRPLIEERLRRAWAIRQRLFPGPYYRVVYGEADGLPGLVADLFGDLAVVQIGTAGMEAVKDAIVQALDEVLGPEVIVLKNDAPIRQLEGLDSYVMAAKGTAPETVTVEENGATFLAPLSAGQKTGWFYDHRLNRARLQAYARGRRVLDLFSYVGGWGVEAARAGAAQVVAVDISREALRWTAHNAALNGVKDRLVPRAGDAFETLRALHDEGERFDIVVLDPPAFVKRKKDVVEGGRAYARLNRLAMQVLSPEGVLVSASCSSHLRRDRLLEILRGVSGRLGREMRILEEGRQPPDHPVHPAIPETGYLKTFFLWISAAR